VNSSEIDDLVAQAGMDDDEDDTGDPPEEEPKPKPARRRSSRKIVPKEPEAPKVLTMEQLDEQGAAAQILRDHVMPKPEENVKTLGDMYAKYRVGVDPGMFVELHRTWPKIFPGGIKADGLYDTFNEPIQEEQIHSTYGGGTYRLRVMGPHPTAPNLSSHFASHVINLAGAPNDKRQPRALQKGGMDEGNGSGAHGVAGMSFPAPIPESTKLSETAMKMMGDMLGSERSERHRVEERSLDAIQSSRAMLDPVIDAERRRADDVVKAERDAASRREAMMEERFAEMRRQKEEGEERMRDQMRSIEAQHASRPSIASELRDLVSAGLFKQGDDGIAKEMLSQVLEKHRGEIEAIQRQHMQFVDSIRSAHLSEIESMRSANSRERMADHEASKSREQRIEDRLGVERSERLRDQDRFKESMESRDQQWKDRLQQQEDMLKASWEARHQSVISSYETRLLMLQGGLDKAQMEVMEARAKREEMGDPLMQMQRMAELREAMKGVLGLDAQPSMSSGGGIGLSGSGGDDDWKKMALEGMGERLPAIAEAVIGKFMGGGQGQAAPPAPVQHKPGDRISTPQGQMVVIPHPQTGELVLMPAQAYDAELAKAQAGRGLLSGPGSGSSRPKQPQRPKISAVQHLGADLPKRRPPWEGGGDDEPSPPRVPEPPPPPPRSPRMTTRTKTPEPVPGEEPMDLDREERQGLKMLAKFVHDSVSSGEEPEEFVQSLMEKVPTAVLHQVIGKYTTDQIVRGVCQVEPRCAAATPAGQQFMRAAIVQVRGLLSQG